VVAPAGTSVAGNAAQSAAGGPSRPSPTAD
jgi:hypothetical protein